MQHSQKKKKNRHYLCYTCVSDLLFRNQKRVLYVIEELMQKDMGKSGAVPEHWPEFL